ncbi:MAG: fasciclin domain-containing protein [Caulobacteraceae bacterium]|nr:fasciclin domain-containing protein [Caulobacteraceae bacterium]
MVVRSFAPLCAIAALALAHGSASAQSAATPAPAAPAVAASPNLTPSGDMVSTLAASPHFTILIKALDAANMSAVLRSTPNLTLFAPTDEAFHALPASQLAALMAPKNANLLQKVLTYHLVHLDLDTSKIKGAKGPVETVETGKLEVDGSGTPLKVNDANIIQTDVKASNGIIQVVDKVLVPSDVTLPTAQAATETTLAAGR